MIQEIEEAVVKASQIYPAVHQKPYLDGGIFGYNLAIDKACDWLRVELDKEEEIHYIHVHGFDKERREIFLEELKKAMKGEQI